jgi:hypothetical protein
MDLWTFIIILVIIGAFKEVFIKKYHGPLTNKAGKVIKLEIDDLKQRIYVLEDQTDIKKLEKRLQAIETIVVDSDYQLNMKFKKAFKEDREFCDL